MTNQELVLPRPAEVINEPADVVELDDRWLRRLGLAVVLLLFGGMGSWAALAPISSAALSQGVVAVESYRKTVQHMEGGIVARIHVREGESVAKDQTLITLEATQPSAQLEVLRGESFIAMAREARLVAQRDQKSEVRYPQELTDNLADPRVADAIRVQTQTFRARRQAYEGEASLYQHQVRELQSKVEGLRAQERSHGRLVGSYGNELNDFEALLKEGYAEKQKVRELQRNLAQSEGQRGELQSSIAATELQISETRLKIVQLGKDLQREVAKELSEVQAELFAVREKIRSLTDTVARTAVKAPEAGVVLGMTTHTLGAVIPPGGKLLDIVPQSGKLLVEAQVPLRDIDRVAVGQKAEIRFSAFKSRTTPKVGGKVISISADSFTEKEMQSSSPNSNSTATSASYYLARVQVTEAGANTLAANNLELVPGMPAEVLINTGSRTFWQYLTDPVRDTFARSFIED